MMNMERSEMNMLPIEGEKGEIILYQPDDNICLEVRLENETVWLSTSQMSVLFGREESNIRRHIQNVFKDGELQSENNVHFLHVNGVKKPVPYYNLDVIISVGYRVHSQQGISFRQWATRILKEVMLRGYSINQHLIALQERIDCRLTTLETRVEDHQQQIDFLIRREEPVNEQLFSTGCVWDAYTFVSNLVRTAADRIILIDPFVDERTLLLLDKRSEGVECIVHTRYNQQIELDFQKHNKQCIPIGKVQLSQAVHDRYLIIDNQVWLLGASVKDMGRGLCTIIKLGFTPDEILNRV